MRLSSIFITIAIISPWFYHLYYCFTNKEYVLLLVGALIAPIGWIHGLGAFLGFW